MKISEHIVFKVLHVLTWIIFVGLCIEAGGILVNFVYSIFKPAIVTRLYQKLDLSAVYQESIWLFYGVYSLLLGVALLKAHLFYKLIELVSKLDLQKPFNASVTKKITDLSYYTMVIGILSIIGEQTTENLGHYSIDTTQLQSLWNDGNAFLLMSAIIYVIAAIFTRGVDIQNENDLTV